MKNLPLIVRQFLAEFYGTFILVLIGTGAIAFGLGNNLLGVAFAFGLGAMIAIYTIGHISGAHLNPAVTLAFLVDKRITIKTTLVYLSGQVLGGFFASLTLWIAQNTSVFQGYGASGINVNQMPLYVAFIFEVFLTFILVYTVLAVSQRKSLQPFVGLIVGFTITGLILVGGPISSAALNPARSLAPALFSGKEALQQLWIYLLGPLLGAFLASMFYRYLKYSE